MIRVHLYAALRERAGFDEVSVAWPEPGGLSVLRTRLAAEFPELESILRDFSILVAVNHEMAMEDTQIQDGDEVGLMPPFSGGSGKKKTAVSPGFGEVRIQSGDFSVDEEIRKTRGNSKRIGAVCTFIGAARDFSSGRAVKMLTFEHYPGLAEKKLDEIRLEAIERFKLNGATIVHRTGRVKAGENIVLIVAAAEHRTAAFDACRWCIDELKSKVPFWKKETTDSEDVWVQTGG